MGSFSIKKGKRGELEFVHLLKDYLGGDWNRNYKQVAEAQHGDIEQPVAGYLIEVKNCKDLQISKWWKQTVAAALARGLIPCLAFKVYREGWRFRIPSHDALAANASWSFDLKYTQELFEEGFFLHVRERGASCGA